MLVNTVKYGHAQNCVDNTVAGKTGREVNQ